MAATVWTSGVLYTMAITKGPQADYVKATLTVIMMALAVVVSLDCAHKWICILTGRICAEETEPERDLMALAEGVEVSD